MIKAHYIRILRGSCVGALTLTAAWSAMAAGAPAPAEDIRDIRPLILIPPWWHWAIAAAAATLALAAIGLGFKLWRRRAERALTPEARARDALARADELAREGRCREWADVVAGTLRAALAARLGKEACPETTRELAAVEWATVANGAAVDAPVLIDLLSTCDLTRFAMARMDADSLVDSTRSARDWITHLFAPLEPSAPSGTEKTP